MRWGAAFVIVVATGCRLRFDATADGADTMTDVTGDGCPQIPGLLARFPMDSGDLVGTTLPDRSGNGHAATLFGAATLPSVPGHAGEALDFTATTMASPVYFELALPFPTAPGAAATFTAWYRRASAGGLNDVVVDMPANDNFMRYDIYLVGASQTCVNTAQSDCWGVDDPTLFDRWVFLAAILRNGPTINSELYVDAQRLDSTCISAPMYPCDQARTVGNPVRLSSKDNYQFRGLMDEVRFYDHALSPDEIAALFADPTCP